MKTRKSLLTTWITNRNRIRAAKQREHKLLTLNTDIQRTEESQGFNYTGVIEKARHTWTGNNKTHQGTTWGHHGDNGHREHRNWTKKHMADQGSKHQEQKHKTKQSERMNQDQEPGLWQPLCLSQWKPFVEQFIYRYVTVMLSCWNGI